MSVTQRPCPDCDAGVGEPCHVPIAGVDTTGWDHDARILAPIYAAVSERAAQIARGDA